MPSIYEGLTQEELATALDAAFWDETGMTCVVSDLSDLIDVHAENDSQHWQFVSFLEFCLRMVKERNNGET